MDISLNEIINYYANASVSFSNIFVANLNPGKSDVGRRTAPGMCGLIIPLQGSANFTLNNQTFAMGIGTIVHAGPQMSIKVDNSSKKIWRYVVLHYEIPAKEKEVYQLYHQHFSLKVDNQTRITRYIKELIKAYSVPGPISKITARTLFHQIIEELVQGAKRNSKSDRDTVIEQAVDFMHQHYTEKISVAEISKRFKINRRRFTELFERHTGLNPSNYIIELRMKEAKEMLRQSDLSIAVIAFQLSYDDPFYFSRIFKKYVGVSPTAYRREIT
ncbi:AraC family transcriptional regulator [Rummeliibacillus sp. TYF005]|uniref:helix-turn-helix domain-containing protein n=1 Tax=Rummeliibacillus sp. TYF005 TaxID=2058214 RepID=UPI000F51F37C|nr:AraC family transcriptional regulator [Rummeliibacillus sp. TYF005]RPJ95335.1 AraC family transcriptional regulator [Rummeliibacillus sp. TYF005]